ncbi:MAG: hypothetical protein OEV00_07250, partial [Acidobacteriota bacterium]|nr:hypothetical protein [Acidobacteriota bacterium]
YAVTEGAPGNLVIGISCAGCSGGADANGTVRLIDLIFETTDSDSNGSALTFNSAALQDSQPPLPGPIAGLSWFGGDLVIN